MSKRRLYCGGSFCFDCRDADYQKLAENDYRARLLGNVDLLLQKSEGVPIGKNTLYIGPFYFETENMTDRDIVSSESKMIRACTDAVFLLDDGLCPGTVSELILASTLKKNIHLFFVQRAKSEETESELHSPCWYPILLSQQLNENTHVYPCESVHTATQAIYKLIFG